VAGLVQLVSSINLNFNVTSDMTESFMKALKDMQAKEVLAGFPESEDGRKDADGNAEPITNAALGYIHNSGWPELNIPARPFMEPGIEDVREKITDRMQDVGIRSS
jgi:hypothetical protein